MTTNIKLQIPEGYEVDKENSTWDNIVLKEKDNWVEKWEDLKRVEGYFVDNLSRTIRYTSIKNTDDDKNTFKTKEQANACVALAQLSQLMYVANEGWEPNWEDSTVNKYVITRVGYNTWRSISTTLGGFLTFKNCNIRDRFAETHKDLILQALPLL